MNNTETRKKIKEVTESKMFKNIICGFGILVAAAIIFEAGIFVGFHRASFGRDWRDNYSRNFGPGRHGPMTGDMPENFPNAHGVIGKIIKIQLPSIIVEDNDNTEKVVLIKDDTQIRKMREAGTKDDLKIDASIIVIGSPNDQGQIEAKLIRILPAPLENSGASLPKPTN
jgi:hypothetical protein